MLKKFSIIFAEKMTMNFLKHLRSMKVKNAVHWFECECNATYCGSTKRTLHTRVTEHLADRGNKSAISAHTRQCSGRGRYSVIDQGRDVTDTRLREAIHIADKKPTLNRKDELSTWVESLP